MYVNKKQAMNIAVRVNRDEKIDYFAITNRIYEDSRLTPEARNVWIQLIRPKNNLYKADEAQIRIDACVGMHKYIAAKQILVAAGYIFRTHKNSTEMYVGIPGLDGFDPIEMYKADHPGYKDEEQG